MRIETDEFILSPFKSINVNYLQFSNAFGYMSGYASQLSSSTIHNVFMTSTFAWTLGLFAAATTFSKVA